MAKTYKSEALAALHESMSDLHQAGAIDNKTMREFDRACLTPVMELSPASIRRRAAASEGPLGLLRPARWASKRSGASPSTA